MEQSNLNSFQQAGLYDVLVSTAMTEEYYMLFKMLKPTVTQDGNQYCVLYGDDIVSGIAGFGSTIYEAIGDFNMQFHKP